MCDADLYLSRLSIRTRTSIAYAVAIEPVDKVVCRR